MTENERNEKDKSKTGGKEEAGGEMEGGEEVLQHFLLTFETDISWEIPATVMKESQRFLGSGRRRGE